jgi:hypothetical protein
MLRPTTNRPAPGETTYRLGVVDMRLLAASEDTGGEFSLGGRLLVLWTPGGLEQMFIELSRLGPDALRDPSARKAVASRFDSIPD